MLSLPSILGEIAEVAGFKAALQVARAKGGTKAYFPARPEGDHWLVKAVGQETALIIGEYFTTNGGGIDLEVPLGPSGERVRMWREIRYRHAAGHTKVQIARDLGITGRTVQYHINGHRPLADAEFELAEAEAEGEDRPDTGEETAAGHSSDLVQAVADNAATMAGLIAENEALRNEVASLRRENDNLRNQRATEGLEPPALIPHRKAA